MNLAIKAAFTDNDHEHDADHEADHVGAGGFLMALHRPRPRTKKPAQQAAGLDGLKVSVAHGATSGVEKSKQGQERGTGRADQLGLRQTAAQRNWATRVCGRRRSMPAAPDHRIARCAGGRNRAASRTRISNYPENKGFDRYSDLFGFHFDSVHIGWI